MFCVVVLFDVKTGFEAMFREKILANAATSLSDESGCHRFDVCEGPTVASFLLYELYETEGAFMEHLRTPHFKRFDAETADWVSDKRVTTYTRLTP